MKFDYDILKEFLPEEDKKSFLVWDNAFYAASNSFSIVAIYRATFEKKIIIKTSDYEGKLKQKERDSRINSILKD